MKRHIFFQLKLLIQIDRLLGEWPNIVCVELCGHFSHFNFRQNFLPHIFKCARSRAHAAHQKCQYFQQLKNLKKS
jgi:hypothetical protein